MHASLARRFTTHDFLAELDTKYHTPFPLKAFISRLQIFTDFSPIEQLAVLVVVAPHVSDARLPLGF